MSREEVWEQLYQLVAELVRDYDAYGREFGPGPVIERFRAALRNIDDCRKQKSEE